MSEIVERRSSVGFHMPCPSAGFRKGIGGGESKFEPQDTMGQKARRIGFQAISMILILIKGYFSLVMLEWADICFFFFFFFLPTYMHKEVSSLFPL